MDLVTIAIDFAFHHHWTRLHQEYEREYDDKLPYPYHLAQVVGVLARFGHTDSEMIAAGWLHDVTEDCGVSVDAKFGPVVGSLVWAVTGVGTTRAERNASAYLKIPTVPLADVLKLGDRIANVEASRANPRKLPMYRREYPDFRAALYVPDGVAEPMWRYLDHLMETAK